MRRLAVVLALAALPLAACGGAEVQDGGGRTPTRSAAPPVSLVRTGGIAGIRESVAVAPDGTWVHVVRAARTTGTLSADQRDQLARMGADPAVAAEARRPAVPITCSDGYALRLTVGDTTVQWMECGPNDAEPPASTEIARLLFAAIN